MSLPVDLEPRPRRGETRMLTGMSVNDLAARVNGIVDSRFAEVGHEVLQLDDFAAAINFQNIASEPAVLIFLEVDHHQEVARLPKGPGIHFDNPAVILEE